jgi:polyisoprenoid-binding protein YceI
VNLLVVSLALVLQHPGPETPLKGGTLSFDGHATLGDFVGTTDSVRGAMRGGPDLVAVTGWVEASVASLRTGNGKRDKDLRKSMEVEQHPTMRFDLAAVLVPPGRPGRDTTDVVLRGTLTLHGRKKEVQLPARVWRADNGWRLRSDFTVHLKDYEVGGLSKMLGILKMNEEIEVHVDVTFGP